MRVLHITEALGGGLQSAITNYVQGVDAEHVMLSRARAGHHTYDLPGNVDTEFYSGDVAGFLRRVGVKTKEASPDLVHLHSSFAGLARAYLPSTWPILYSPHCFGSERRDVSTATRLAAGAAERLLARRNQVIVAVSGHEAHLARSMNPRNPVVVVKNPAPRSAAGLREPKADQSRIVVMVGRVCAQKDPGLFAEVARSARTEGLRFVWVGAGDAAECAPLRAAGVEVTGWVTPAEVREWLGRAAVYMHTGAWEGGPLSGIEAAAMGVPVLSRSIPAMESLGYAVGGATAEHLAHSLDRMFGSPDYHASVVAATARVAADSSWEAMAAGLDEAYALALGSSRPSSARDAHVLVASSVSPRRPQARPADG